MSLLNSVIASPRKLKKEKTESKSKASERDISLDKESESISVKDPPKGAKAKEAKEKESTDESTKPADDDEFDLSDLLKGISQTKICVGCQAVIPGNCVSCYSCHTLQPFSMIMDVTDYAPFKSEKGFTIKRQMVYDADNDSRGIVWKNVIFKVNQQLQYFLSSGGISCSFSGDSNKKKKDRKAYAEGLQVVTNLSKLQQLATGYTSGADVIIAFIEAVKSVREEMLKDAKKLVQSRDIVYDALWFLFERGTPIYYTDYNSDCIYGTIVTHWDYLNGFSRSFKVTGTTIISDGQGFYEHPVNTMIPYFRGIVKIDLLPVKKLTRNVHSVLTERGKTYASVAMGAHFKQYTGALLSESVFGYMKFRATGRIMLDTSTFNRMNPNNTRFATPNQNELLQRRQNNPRDNDKYRDALKELKDNQLWMTYPTMPGFSFPLKKWGEFLIENVSDIIFDDHSFIQLVLPEDKKKMIKALVEEHQNSGEFEAKQQLKKNSEIGSEEKNDGKKKAKDINGMKRQPDLIKNKGGGCIFLLHGPPGVGKTLTAEAVSEHLHIPLYQVTVGELGTEPEQLEKSLGNLLELAALWNASILLDEADIFLERRSRNDILRNAMVGIFLRLLEYHQGVLFLTTNRVDCLDEAFSSRISIAIYYPNLDDQARAQVWKNFLVDATTTTTSTTTTTVTSTPKSTKSKKPKVEVSHDFVQLSKYELNGRQIRSCVRMARALANSEKSVLTQEHLLQTVQLSLDFSKRFENRDGKFDELEDVTDLVEKKIDTLQNH